jgi:hypothetical protein
MRSFEGGVVAQNGLEKLKIIRLCVCVCVCVCERERERERESEIVDWWVGLWASKDRGKVER